MRSPLAWMPAISDMSKKWPSPSFSKKQVWLAVISTYCIKMAIGEEKIQISVIIQVVKASPPSANSVYVPVRNRNREQKWHFSVGRLIYKLSDDIHLSGIIGVNDIELTIYIDIANRNSHTPVGCAEATRTRERFKGTVPSVRVKTISTGIILVTKISGRLSRLRSQKIAFIDLRTASPTPVASVTLSKVPSLLFWERVFGSPPKSTGKRRLVFGGRCEKST